MKTSLIKFLKFAKGLVDLALAALIFIPVYFLYMLPAALLFRARTGGAGNGKCILYMIPGGGINSVASKHGGDWMYREKDLDGYFDKVIIFNFATENVGRIDMGSKMLIVDQLKYMGTFVWVTTAMFTIRAFGMMLRHRPSVIRAQDPYFVAIAATIVGRLTRTPHCISLHANFDLLNITSGGVTGPFYLGSRRLAKLGERMVLSRAPFVLPISRNVGEYAVASGARPDTIRVINHGRDPAQFVEEPDGETIAEFIKPGVFSIVYVGRIHKEKRVMDLVEIAAELERRGLEFNIIICGDGPHRAEFDAVAAERGVSNRISHHGFVPSKRAIKVMKAGDVNFCTIGAFALIESAMSGKPVVTYRVEWNEELIEHEVTGMLADDGDVMSVCDAIVRLKNDPGLAARIARHAKETAIARHSLQFTQDTKRRVMDEIINSRAK